LKIKRIKICCNFAAGLKVFKRKKQGTKTNKNFGKTKDYITFAARKIKLFNT